MRLGYQEGLTDIDNALHIARGIEVQRSGQKTDSLNQKVNDLIGLLVRAKESFEQANSSRSDHFNNTSAQMGQVLASRSSLPAAPEYPPQRHRVSLTDEELQMLLG